MKRKVHPDFRRIRSMLHDMKDSANEVEEILSQHYDGGNSVHQEMDWAISDVVGCLSDTIRKYNSLYEELGGNV